MANIRFSKGVVDGVRFVADRCGKCGEEGHRAFRCQNPLHPKYDPDSVFALLFGMSHGLPGYPIVPC